MSYYDERMRELQKKLNRKNRLESMLREMYNRQRILRGKAEELKYSMLKEQDDVDCLECGSLAAFFYQVVGRMDDRLTKECQEAYAAKVKYDAAAAGALRRGAYFPAEARAAVLEIVKKVRALF